MCAVVLAFSSGCDDVETTTVDTQSADATTDQTATDVPADQTAADVPADQTAADVPADLAHDQTDATTPDLIDDAVQDQVSDATELLVDMVIPPARGTCVSEADCGGEACLGLGGENGWHTCASPVAEAVGCQEQGMDACCTSADCTEVACFTGPRFYCGGAFPPMANLCAADECATNADCSAEPFGACVPAGAFNEHVARCTYGDCVLDSDCSARAGGACLPFFNPCNHRFIGLNCTYADSLCKQDSDCLGGSMGNGYCAPGANGVTTCEDFLPPP